MNPHSETIPESRGETLSISQVRPETFETMFSRYRHVLYLVSYRILNNHQDAKEAVQTAYFRPLIKFHGSSTKATSVAGW
jgi:DNA-directed RNA polymerase specialized sigma24 family protein